MSFIGIDLGTSFIKGAVLDLDAQQLQHIHRVPFPEQLPNSNPLICEFDPGEIVSAFQNLVNMLSEAAPDCQGIVICTQMHGMVLMDSQRAILTPCMTWRDQRALMPHPSGKGTYFDVLAGRINRQQCNELGNELRPGTPSGFLFWMAEQGNLPPEVIPVSMPDFVLSVLTGCPPSVEATNAMAYGLLNLQTMEWHRGVIEELGFGRLRWPQIRRHGDVVAHLNLGGNRVPCYTPVGDYQCALLGALLDQDEVSLNVSTGSQVSRLTPGLELGDYQSRPFFDGMFTNTFTHIPAGRHLDVLVDLLSELARGQLIEVPDPWSYIAREALAVEETDLGVDLNYFANPFGDHGTISNLRQDNMSIGHLFRAAFVNMAQRFYDCAVRIWPNRQWQRLVYSGGLICKIEALQQSVARRFETPYRLAPFSEDTLTGLLIMARTLSGRAGSIHEAMRDLRARTMA